MAMTRRLIEEWLPIAELSEESVRERRSMTALPPIYYLHVRWARRPLVAARAAVLASLLPADADRKTFMHALGIHGDPVAAQAKMAKAKRTGKRVEDPYGYPRAFSYSPSATERSWFKELAQNLGIENASCLDPTAGGGSIPFESLRLGCSTYANDLNPVASLVEKMTLEIPINLSTDAYLFYNKISNKWRNIIQERLDKLFPQPFAPNQFDMTYLWARTIRCPHCGGLIPLSPNWRLASDGTGVKLTPHCSDNEEERICTFEIVHSAKEQSKETVKGGTALCPYPDCGRVIDGDMVKAIAQEGKMGEQLYAIVYKKKVQTITKSGVRKEKWERGYRAPRPEDDNMAEVRSRLEEKLPEWEALDIVPIEEMPKGLKTKDQHNYGTFYWREMFSARQLYCHCTSVEVFREIFEEYKKKNSLGDSCKIAFGYLALSIDTLINYGTRSCRWDDSTGRVRALFDRHDFASIWSYAEMAPLIVGLGYDWAIEKTAKCMIELLELVRNDVDGKRLRAMRKHSEGSLMHMLPAGKATFTPPALTLTNKSADCLDHLADHSIDAVVMDPPYYDNVMYAELSDFFYVWLKRTAGYVYPELFVGTLTDKENEAVANPAKFQGQKKAKDLAYSDYRKRMSSIFAECRRVLTEDGILTLMFTHKATGAWDALAKGLMDAGFIISASWPVNTEAEGSLHIKDKAAANSTIFLVCRPKQGQVSGEAVFWEDLEQEVRREVLQRIEAFRKAGIFGIDLYLASFGPALEVFSRHWPVKRGQPKPSSEKKKRTLMDELEDPYAVTPEDVLETAREAVKQWRLQKITDTAERRIDLDPLTEWFVLAWDAFHAPQFEYDEALGLARVCGLDLDKDVIGHIAEKKASNVILWDSQTRAAKAALGPASGVKTQLDTLHHAARIAQNENLSSAKTFLEDLKVHRKQEFLDALRAVLEVLPPSRRFTGADLPKGSEPAGNDFEALEDLRVLLCADRVKRPVQLSLFDISESTEETK